MIDEARKLVARSCRLTAIRCRPYIEVSDYAEKTVVDAFVAETVAAAEKELSRPGMPVRCDVADWCKEHLDADAFRRRGRSYEEVHEASTAAYRGFRPSILWEHIKDSYSPQRLQQETWERAACNLVEAFDLRQQSEIKRVSGRIELDIRMWSEPTFSDPSLRSYSTSSAMQFTPLPEAVQVLASSSGLDLERYDLQGFAASLADITRCSHKFRSRDRADFNGALSVVYFQNAIKVYLPEPVAAAINMSVSEHGQAALRRYS